ncbi:hypothetical protein BpHYR1_051312 [Brachionus plicatilis]|uniref:Uncharacterized protein n=1 Tax=Brachionus plicatilis TaxID=10195 RepID=A0A3M7SSW7_BRAPC|nr:hypothetical protein BpHYR1_051312 [Brachionus plicatilis]
MIIKKFVDKAKHVIVVIYNYKKKLTTYFIFNQTDPQDLIFCNQKHKCGGVHFLFFKAILKHFKSTHGKFVSFLKERLRAELLQTLIKC